jgi:hypothetical protein
MDNVLRFRLKEEGMLFRYGGQDLVDMKPVEWVELVDRDERTFRLAVLQNSHLLARSVVITRDETTRERTEEVTAYGNYHMEGQVMAPLQLEKHYNEAFSKKDREKAAKQREKEERNN